jgi:hypothetical protein
LKVGVGDTRMYCTCINYDFERVSGLVYDENHRPVTSH